MTLLELLVKELPGRGGWPEGAEGVVQDSDDTEFYFFTGHAPKYNGISWWFAGDTYNCSWIYHYYTNDMADDNDNAIITRDQYEAALAASQQPVWLWPGKAMPPAGVDCEVFDCETWNPVTIKFVGEKNVVTQRIDLGCEVVYCLANRPDRFRPIRTEAERKREEVFNHLLILIDSPCSDAALAGKIYDAIAAGKIPGVKLTDEG